jgi:hypothetical protein
LTREESDGILVSHGSRKSLGVGVAAWPPDAVVLEEQLIVIGEALRLLREAREPGSVEHLDREWPDFEKWKTAWYPPELPPIIKVLVERLRGQAKEERKGSD